MKSKMNKNSTGPRSIFKFLTIFLLSLAILIGTFLILRPKMKTLDLYYDFGDEYASIEVILEPEGIATLDRIYQEDGVVHAILKSAAEGEAMVQVECYHDQGAAQDPDSEGNYSASFYTNVYVNHFGMMYTGAYDFSGVRTLILALGLVFLASAIALFYWYRQSRRSTFFSYKTILDFGLGIYFLVQALVLLGAVMVDIIRPDLGIRGYHFFILCGFSMSLIVIVSFPILFIFSLMLSISNLALIKKEGRRFSNTLGILLSAALMLGILACVYMVFAFPSTLDFNSKDAALILIRGIISTIFFYFECNLFSTLLHCQRAGRRRWAGYRKPKKSAENTEVQSSEIRAQGADKQRSNRRNKISFDKDYLIILGCGIREDGTLYPLLQGRADCAIDFYKAQLEATGRKAFFVPSGGQGPDECMPEGEAIKNYLLSRGIP
nr:YdcF family protein [Eubacterium sp.]